MFSSMGSPPSAEPVEADHLDDDVGETVCVRHVTTADGHGRIGR
jgi:hypothetical protein